MIAEPVATTATDTQRGPERVSRKVATEVATQFEAIFLEQMVSQMRKGADVLGQSEMFGGGPGADTYAQWFDDHMSMHLASSGRIGIADVLVSDMERADQIELEDDAVDPDRANHGEGELHHAEEPSRERVLDRVV